jgi:hypothetical protein
MLEQPRIVHAQHGGLCREATREELRQLRVRACLPIHDRDQFVPGIRRKLEAGAVGEQARGTLSWCFIGRTSYEINLRHARCVTGAQLLLPVPGFAILPSGKILVAAAGLVRSESTQGLVGRYRADGRIDHSWGRDGWAVVTGGHESPRGLAPLPGGALAVGAVFSGPGARGGEDFGAVGLDRSGGLDRDFATGGSCRASLPGDQEVIGVLRVGDRAVVLGSQGGTRWMLDCPPLP